MNQKLRNEVRVQLTSALATLLDGRLCCIFCAHLGTPYFWHLHIPHSNELADWHLIAVKQKNMLNKRPTASSNPQPFLRGYPCKPRIPHPLILLITNFFLFWYH